MKASYLLRLCSSVIAWIYTMQPRWEANSEVSRTKSELSAPQANEAPAAQDEMYIYCLQDSRQQISMARADGRDEPWEE